MIQNRFRSSEAENTVYNKKIQNLTARQIHVCTALRCVRTPGAGHASTGRMDDVTENDCVDRTAVHVAMPAEDIHLLDHSVIQEEWVPGVQLQGR